MTLTLSAMMETVKVVAWVTYPVPPGSFRLMPLTTILIRTILTKALTSISCSTSMFRKAASRVGQILRS